MFAWFVWFAGCHDSGEAPDGSGCEADGECRSGFCWAGCRDPGADDDGDGLDNRVERQLGLSPLHRDTDGDGLADGDEVGDVSRPRDTDGDGRIDALESQVEDGDGDCLPDPLDASEEAASDGELAATLCRVRGVCEGQVVARCVEGQGVCDYTQIAAHEPVEASCDGLDNDCDGQTDEGLVYLESTGALRVLGESCAGLGECASELGVVECGARGQVVCSVDRDGSQPAGDLEDRDCDGLDNDCDGQVDEGVSWVEPDTGLVRRFGTACRARGACGLVTGRVECSSSGRGICSTEPGGSADLSGPERCDGLDEDCDGRTDEGLSFTDPSAPEGAPALLVGEPCGFGACAGSTVACAGGVAVCPGLAAAGDEACNGLDDDCDGAVDEVEDVAQGCSTLGVCAGREVVASCDGVELVCHYRFDDAQRAAALSDEVCDGLDEDCDGETDEDLVVVGGGRKGDRCLGNGLCATVEGYLVCAAGGLVCSADAGLAEVCDGVDNDCDGTTDEEASGAPACRTLGVCAAASPLASCEGGGWRCPHEDLPDFSETEAAGGDCDGLDNDCDGLVDEGSALVPEGSLERVWAAPAPHSLMAAASGGGTLWVHGGLGDGTTSSALWRFSGRWERVAALEEGPALAGHAAAFDPDLGVLVIQGGFQQVGAEDPALGPGGEPVSSMWVFDPQRGRWAQVSHLLEGASIPSDLGVAQAEGRILARRHHALVALGDGRLVLHGGRAAEGAPEALMGTLSRDGDAWVCRWVTVAGPGWRAGHSASLLDVGGVPWVVLAGGTGASGWAAFTPEGAVAVIPPETGPIGELRVGLVARTGDLGSMVVAVGARTHVLEARLDGARVAMGSREVPGGLTAPFVAGRIGTVPVAVSLGSGEVLEVGPTGGTTSRPDLGWPAPRRHAALLSAGGAAPLGMLPRQGLAPVAGVGLWLVGGERVSDGAPLDDLWFWAWDEGQPVRAEAGERARWTRVPGVAGRGGRTRFAMAPADGARAPTLWAASPGPTGVSLARLTLGAQVRWQEIPAVGVGPTSVAALSVLDDPSGTSVFVLSMGASGLEAHRARVEEAGGSAPGAVWAPVGQWWGATAVLALGPVGERPATALGVAASVGDGFEVRRLDPSGFGPATALSPYEGAGDGRPEAPSLPGPWALGADRGYLVADGGVWVLDAGGGRIGWHAVPGLRAGATALGEDASLWRFGADLTRVPLVCE